MACWRVFLLLVSCWSVLAGEGAALPVSRLAAEASLVVRGEVERKTTRRDEAGRILTEVQVVVQETWKGNLKKPALTLLHGGGILGNVGARVTGQAHYAPGEKVVLFLVPNGQGQFVTVGMEWGKFLVIEDPDSGKPMGRQSGSSDSPIPLADLQLQVSNAQAHE